MMPQDLYQNSYSRPLLHWWISKREVGERLCQWKCGQYFYMIFLFSMSDEYLQSLEINRNFSMKHLYLMHGIQHDRPTKARKEKDYQRSHLSKPVSCSFTFLHTSLFQIMPIFPSSCGWLLKQLQKWESLKTLHTQISHKKPCTDN